jgi:hypothetical protein
VNVEPKLTHDERVRQQEESGENRDPEERLRAEARDLAERVHADHRADREEQHVDTPQALLELALLFESKRRRRLDAGFRCSHSRPFRRGWGSRGCITDPQAKASLQTREYRRFFLPGAR